MNVVENGVTSREGRISQCTGVEKTSAIFADQWWVGAGDGVCMGAMTERYGGLTIDVWGLECPAKEYKP